MKTQKFWQQIAAIVGMVVGLMVQVDANASSTTDPPAGYQPKNPNYVTAKPSDALAIAAAGTPVIRVYQDSIPWFGDGRDQATLLALGTAAAGQGLKNLATRAAIIGGCLNLRSRSGEGTEVTVNLRRKNPC
ncbi:MAG: hypothetical protein ACREYF_10400 [Gammaproteobacteria bacterium]